MACDTVPVDETNTSGSEIAVYDPWQMLGQILHSLHCQGLHAKVTAYDHTGWIQAQCDCGKEYTHDLGAFDKLTGGTTRSLNPPADLSSSLLFS